MNGCGTAGTCDGANGCWYLKAPKSIGDPDLRHWNVTQGHAVSDDLVTWSDHSTALTPAAAPAWDDKTTWTGSTLRGEDGRWHYFCHRDQPGRKRDDPAHRPCSG